MRALLFATALGLSLPYGLQAQAFDFQKLSKTVFGSSGVYGTEDPDAREIDWKDLSPPLSAQAQAAAAKLNAMIDTMNDEDIDEAMALIDENGDEIIEALDGETITLEGYLVPLDFEATDAKAFVLVPYMGACIHVPPPPPNQVVFIEYEDGIPMEALEQNIWTPFRVTGDLRAAPTTTELADVGYQMSAKSIRVSEL